MASMWWRVHMERATAGQQAKPIHDLCCSDGRRRSGGTGDRARASGAEDFSL
jgi:hypothetical protein